jgi:broad-specificity NMP kinase
MIVELFGPPGAGKTTFARALAERLRERNYAVDLVLSHRPAERSPNENVRPSTSIAREISLAARRLTRPLIELLSMILRPRGISRDLEIAFTLIKILPPPNTLSSLRLLQYMSRLSRAWFRSFPIVHIVLFDQAFVQAVCSLALLCGVADEALISYALNFIPEPDLLIHLDAPTELLEDRLRDRHHLGGKIERLLELDVETSLSSRGIVDLLHELLRRKGRNVVSISSLDQASLATAVEQMERHIAVVAEQHERGKTKTERVKSTLSGQLSC